MARLLLATPEGHQVVELLAHNSLGRHPGNTVQLLDRIVSKEHCIIEQRGELFVLRDLGSLNGTYVNGDRVVGERALRSGDEIALGATRARYEQDEAGGAPAALPMPQAALDGGWTSSNAPSLPSVAEPAVAASGQADSFGVARAPLTFAFGSIPSLSDTSPLPFATSMPPMSTRRIDVTDKARAIGTQIAAAQKGFLPYDALASNPHQLAADYERLRLSHELSREIALERDLATLLDKILLTIFKFIRADRGAIFLMAPTGELVPAATRRRDGTDQPITVSSTILNHVIEERATVLTHDAAMDFAASKGKSMILNRISSAVVAPLLHNDDVLGVLWLDSESLAQFQQKDMEIATAIAAQAAMFIEINILGKKIEQEIVNRERFSRLLSPNIAERVLSGELEVKKGGQLVPECTVFNSDIRGFT
ncbi:MAG TPA: FHA domain-containing protein, partial [Polyangiaceae bacterium]